MSGFRLDFELDHEVGLGALGSHGGEACEDLDRLRGQDGLGLLLGHGLPAAQTARDFLATFEEPDLPLLGSGRSAVREEGLGLRGLSRASVAVVADLQAWAPQRVATIDLDATILASSKRAARPCYDGRRGYQPVVALWAEQDAIVADEFRDGNVSAQSGNRRVIERALAALPGGVERVFLRADSALYDHSLMVYLDQRKVGFAISVPVSPGLMRRMQGLDEAAWHLEREDGRRAALVGGAGLSARRRAQSAGGRGAQAALYRHPHQPQAGLAVRRRRGGQALLRRHQPRRPTRRRRGRPVALASRQGGHVRACP
ncbi:MAG: transposase [Alphaproteobacteria bacterium]|nr:transposase [Alphaproteobacteria bacterium]